MNFDQAFEKLIGHEGGYVCNPADPGGETRYGISKRSYPLEDIKGMTLDRAKEIYRRDFWDKCQADELADEVRFDVFDAAVNSGVKQSIKWLQRAVNTTDDGVLGPATMAACRVLPGYVQHARFNGHRLQFMASLPTWTTFGRGWAIRVSKNLLEV